MRRDAIQATGAPRPLRANYRTRDHGISRSVEVSYTKFNGGAGTSSLTVGWAIRKRLTVGFTKSNGATMTKLKTLSAIIIFSAAIATPVFAQDTGVVAPHHARHHARDYRGSYNQVSGPSYATPRTRDGSNVENFGFSGMDRSFPGGEDPSLHPSGS
jgi:hypothetical protein